MSKFRKVFVNRDDGEKGLAGRLRGILESDTTPREKILRHADELYASRNAAETARRKQQEEMRELLTPRQPQQVGFSDEQFQELRRLLLTRPPPPTPSYTPGFTRDSLMARRETPLPSPPRTPPTPALLEDEEWDSRFFKQRPGSPSPDRKPVRKRGRSRGVLKNRPPVSVKLATELGVPQLADNGSTKKRGVGRVRRRPTRYSS